MKVVKKRILTVSILQLVQYAPPWEFGVYGEEEEEIAAKSEDPIMKEIWENKIAVVDINVKPVFQGKQALINWVLI